MLLVFGGLNANAEFQRLPKAVRWKELLAILFNDQAMMLFKIPQYPFKCCHYVELVCTKCIISTT